MGNSLSSSIVRSRILLVLAVLLLAACGSEEDGAECSYFSRECAVDEGSGEDIVTACGTRDVGIVDGCGAEITTLDIHDPVVVNLEGLDANSLHTVIITDSNNDDITLLAGYAAGSSGLTSDQDGNIFMSTIVQNMPNTAATGEYVVTVLDDTPVVVETIDYTVEDRNRVFCADSANPDTAVGRPSFTSSDNVFAVVSGSLGNGNYDVYVIADNQTVIPNSGLIPGDPVTISLSGGTGGLDLGTFNEGAYDVLVDVNGNGIYNRDTDLMSRHARLHPCFAVQDINGGASIIEQIAADRNSNKREIFDPDANKLAIRDIFANLTPGELSADTTPGTADIYVVAHQDTWNTNDLLLDLSGTAPPESNNAPVQSGVNAQGNTLQWGYNRLDPGCYDVVVDTNRDGMYTVGTDFVDNINHLGDTTDCGFRVSTYDNVNVTITSHADEEITTSTAVEITGVVSVPSGTLEAAYIRITSGTQTNIISLDALTTSGGGNYAVTVPLFAGDNYITVSAIYSDESSRSETIQLRSVTDLALFRAQLTWDGSTDMDLHVVRPGGSYSNGGGGVDDCNWQNCDVGLDGLGTNPIDWGQVGIETDDPKLDVDCVSCGNGIENIWMNEIDEDGVYQVYVDAFSGDEDDSEVIVTISILGSTVARVNCGNMEAGSATDSCYVGDINWRGGNGGAGSFSVVGTLGTDF